MHVDASSIVLGIVLPQPREGDIENHISFASHNLSKVKKNYTTNDREGLAMVYALHKFINYLLGSHFKLFIDHLSLH